MRNQKGITIISLVITIILLLIIASITVYTGSSLIKQAKLQTINTNMMLIQAKTKTIAEQAKFNNDKSNYKGTPLNTISVNLKIEKLKNEEIIGDNSNHDEGMEPYSDYYLLSSEDLKSMGLDKINIEDGYVVNYETTEVIYVKGFETNGITYYRLSDMKTLTVEEEE